MNDTNTTNQQRTKKLIIEREEKELRLIIIGKSGNGKSAFGNTLCGAKVFQTSSSLSSCTKECRVRYRDFEGTTLLVCDTPGMFDTVIDLKDTKKEICRPLERMVSPGPHAFLIVLKAGQRFTEEEQKTIDYINEMFGSSAAKYCILIITREEDILNDDKTIDEYLQEANEPLKRLVAQCGNRYLAINNFSSQPERDEKVRRLIKMVRNMLKENQTPYYTNEMFQQAEKEFAEQEIEALNSIQAQTKEQIRELREEIRQELQQKLQTILPTAAYDLRNIQRQDANNPWHATAQKIFDLLGGIVQSVGNGYIANAQNRPAIAAIEAQAIRDERRDMIISESMRRSQLAICPSNSDHDYIVQGSGETDSDSDVD